MSCARHRKRLGAYADGELALRIERQIDAHLEQCPACRARLASLREADALLAEIPEPPPPPAWLAARVAARARTSRDLRALPKRPPSDRARLLPPWLLGRPMTMRLATALTAAIAVFAGVAMGTSAAGGGPPLAPATELTAVPGVEWLGVVPPGALAASYIAVSEAKR